MAKSKFKITQVKNPSGAVAWRLSGTLNGKRIRENYKTRAQAVAKRQEYDVEHLNAEPEGQTVWTTLTHKENRDAIAAVNQLKAQQSEYSLSFAVDYFLSNYQAPKSDIAAADAAQEYLDQRDRDCLRGFLSTLQYKSIYFEMNWFKRCFADRPLASVTEDELRDYLEKPKNQPTNRRKPPAVTSLKTWNNRRGMLNTFFRYSVEKAYIGENPIDRVPKYKQTAYRSTAQTLKASEAKELMHFLETYTGPEKRRPRNKQPEGFLVPFFALALFGGIRPDALHGEMSKLAAKDIDLETDVIRVEPHVSKVKEKRVIKIQPNLKCWLEHYPLDAWPLIPKTNADRTLREVRTMFSIGHDVLRHTFISMTVGAFRSVGDAALQAGNSEAVIRKHYLDLKSVEEADSFWRIVPEGVELPELEKKDGRYVLAK